MQKILSKAEVIIGRLKPRHLLAAFFILLLAFVMLWSASRIKKVTVDIDGEIITKTTALADPYRVLEELEVEIEPEDIVTITGFGDGGFFGELGQNHAEIRIQRAVNIEIVADKLTYHVTAAEGDTVSDVLEISGLEVREHDFLNIDESKKVEEGDDIKLTRVDYIITTEEESVPRDKTYRGTSLISGGKTVLLSYGKNGTRLKTYEQKVVDGVYGERVLVSDEITKKATNDLYVVGDGSVISPLDYGFEIVNGVPTTYEKVHTNVRATGYYAPYGAGTATGRLAQVGYVAVDPKIVPYGTKMWIVAHGNTGFVYGYALAADTGGAMLSGKNFVDLYYETYYECVLNGLRYVDVYILETPKDKK
ncbi:MAG: G5 domain-containing protein [Oscillospiraceae bacterium]|nr:G5 domain-containing protein [Oscillospiraceae bacterium]